MTHDSMNEPKRSISVINAPRIFATLGVLAICSHEALAQWTVTYNVDGPQALAALDDQRRVDAMSKALDRAKAHLEKILVASTGTVSIDVVWGPTAEPGVTAQALSSIFQPATVTSARDKLIAKATADDESVSEISLYEALPNGVLPYFYDTPEVRSANFITIPNSLNKHLAFSTTTNQIDGSLTFRPPDAETKWQFWEGKKILDRHILFEATVVHETMHVLGFTTFVLGASPPSSLTTLDMLRFSDGAVPITAQNFTSTPREFRPTEEASVVTALNSATRSYKAARGRRAGGDGYGTAHWRDFERLTPPTAIGIMDPRNNSLVEGNLSFPYFTRADVEALDVIGWNADPADSSLYAFDDTVNLTAPAPSAAVASGSSITFEWSTGANDTVSVYIFSGTEIVDDEPVRVFYQMPGGTTSVVLPVADSLPPGEYVWGVVSRFRNKQFSSEDRRFTILAACDSIDFNNNGAFPEDQDVLDFFNVLGGGECSSGNVCNDIDFNNNGAFPEDQDVLDFLNVLAGGACP